MLCSMWQLAGTMMHVIRDCVLAKEVWLQILAFESVKYFFAAGFDEWLHEGLNGRFKFVFSGSSDHVLFSVQSWLIWKNKNKFIFEQSGSKVEELVRVAECMASNIEAAGCRSGSHQVSR